VTPLDVVPGPGDVYLTPLGEYGGVLYFDAYTAATGYELYNLSADDTFGLVADIVPGTGSGDPNDWLVF
jgi:ELWxxDGT repeat protein